MPRTNGAPPADAAAAAATAALSTGQKKKRARSTKNGGNKAKLSPATTCDQCRSNGLPCDGKSPCGSCVSKFMEKHRHTGIDGIDLKTNGVGCSYNVTDDGDNRNKRKKAANSQQPQKQKTRFRMNGGIIELSSDAIIIIAPLEGTKHFGPRYGMEELCTDMHREVEQAKQSTANLISMTKGDTPVEDQRDLLAEYERAFLSMSRGLFLLSQWKVAHDRGEIAKAPVIAPTASTRKARGISLEDEAKASSSISQLLLAANNAQGNDEDDDDSGDITSNDDSTSNDDDDDDETDSSASEEK